MSKRRKYRPLSEKAVTAIYWLFQHYGKNRDFMKEFGEFIDAHEAELAKHLMPEKMDESAPSISQAKELADRWGLNASWAPTKIIWEAKINHSYRWEAVINGVKPNHIFKYRFPLNAMVTMYRFPSPDKRRVTLDMEYNPSEETWPKFLDRLTKEARCQGEAIERRFEAKGMVPVEHKSELERNIRWLYERIALGRVPQEIRSRDNTYNRVNEIDSPILTKDAVQEGIRQMARLLEIDLPHNHQ